MIIQDSVIPAPRSGSDLLVALDWLLAVGSPIVVQLENYFSVVELKNVAEPVHPPLLHHTVIPIDRGQNIAGYVVGATDGPDGPQARVGSVADDG